MTNAVSVPTECCPKISEFFLKEIGPAQCIFSLRNHKKLENISSKAGSSASFGMFWTKIDVFLAALSSSRSLVVCRLVGRSVIFVKK